jgi:hypothetical protein
MGDGSAVAAEVIFEGPQLVSPYGLWPAHFDGLQLIAPSVYAKTGWVWRGLDVSELGAAWDLPVHTVASIRRMDDDGVGSKTKLMKNFTTHCSFSLC